MKHHTFFINRNCSRKLNFEILHWNFSFELGMRMKILSETTSFKELRVYFEIPKTNQKFVCTFCHINPPRFFEALVGLLKWQVQSTVLNLNHEILLSEVRSHFLVSRSRSCGSAFSWLNNALWQNLIQWGGDTALIKFYVVYVKRLS